MSCSMIDTYSDDFGLLDFRRSQHGSGMSSRSQVHVCCCSSLQEELTSHTQDKDVSNAAKFAFSALMLLVGRQEGHPLSDSFEFIGAT